MVHHKFSFYPEHIPRELKAGRFWVCCDPHKVPQVPGTRRRASSTNPATWRSYAEAAAWFADGHHAGIGRVIAHGDPYAGVDLDGVRDPASGTMKAPAREILEALDSYSEISPSGDGVKIWVKAQLDRSYVKPGLEIYRGGRYFVVTGQVVVQHGDRVRERQEEILRLIERAFPRPGRGSSAVTGGFAGAYDGPAKPPDIGEFLERGSVEVLRELPDAVGAKYQITCPWWREHTGGDRSGTRVGQRAGGLWFHCEHSHCRHRGWREFRAHTERAGKVLARMKEGTYFA